MSTVPPTFSGRSTIRARGGCWSSSAGGRPRTTSAGRATWRASSFSGPTSTGPLKAEVELPPRAPPVFAVGDDRAAVEELDRGVVAELRSVVGRRELDPDLARPTRVVRHHGVEPP